MNTAAALRLKTAGLWLAILSAATLAAVLVMIQHSVTIIARRARSGTAFTVVSGAASVRAVTAGDVPRATPSSVYVFVAEGCVGRAISCSSSRSARASPPSFLTRHMW